MDPPGANGYQVVGRWVATSPAERQVTGQAFRLELVGNKLDLAPIAADDQGRYYEAIFN